MFKEKIIIEMKEVFKEIPFCDTSKFSFSGPVGGIFISISKT